MSENSMLEVAVKGLTFDPVTNVPIVILKDVNGKRVLPIWIGVFEANAIALEMESVDTPRPMTHDLFKNLFEVVHSRMLRVVVDNLMDNTFYATIYLDCQGEEVKLDSRPSDAIALALRALRRPTVARVAIHPISMIRACSRSFLPPFKNSIRAAC